MQYMSWMSFRRRPWRRVNSLSCSADSRTTPTGIWQVSRKSYLPRSISTTMQFSNTNTFVICVLITPSSVDSATFSILLALPVYRISALGGFVKPHWTAETTGRLHVSGNGEARN
jgi:hypothetical protein